MILPNELLDGYRTLRLIGAGGFGAVWLCRSEVVGDLRALKFIPMLDRDRHDREFEALVRYRQFAMQLRSPAIMPIEHVNRNERGLFYIMPLCDGYGAVDPASPDWRPTTLSAVLEGQRASGGWLSMEHVRTYMRPILEALQRLSDVGLVHRDVKPDNILFLNGVPCLADISLLGEDSYAITRRGTPGYSAPSWYMESGGHPDMYGAATTLYSLLTGNFPDKMGRARFKWPPQGEESLSKAERAAFLEMHGAIRRAIDERPAERFPDFRSFERALSGTQTLQRNPRAVVQDAWRGLFGAEQESGAPGPIGLARRAMVLLGLVALGVLGGKLAFPPRGGPVEKPPIPLEETPRPGPAQPLPGQTAPEEIQAFRRELAEYWKTLTFPRDAFAAEMDEIAADLAVYDPDAKVDKGRAKVPVLEIEERFKKALRALPPKPDVATRERVLKSLRLQSKHIGTLYGREARDKLDEDILQLESQLNTDLEFKKEQGAKVLGHTIHLINTRQQGYGILRFAQNFSFDGSVK